MYRIIALTTIALMVSSAALISSVAVAGDNMTYKDVDANQDGKISPQEAAAMPGLSDQWTALDANADGMLDQAEFAKMEVREMKQTHEYQGTLPK